MRALRLILAAGLAWICAGLPGDALTSAQNLLLLGAARPAVYTDFTQTGGALPSSLYAYSGASLRTITDATGAITYAPNNLLPYSNTFTSWAVSGSPTVTPNYGTDPYGGNTATRLQYPSAASGNRITLTPTTSANQNQIFSVWMKGTSASGSIYLQTQVSPGADNFTLVNFTTSWQKFNVDLTTVLGGGTFGIRNNSINAVDIEVAFAGLTAVTYETLPRPGDQVVTTSAAYYGPAFDYSATSIGTPLGLRIEESRTNLFLNTSSPATQTITVASGSAYTISFYGTGTITLSGACTQVMTGSAYPTRTTYTCTTSTTSLVATVVAGTMSYPQVELGAFPTSAIPTAGSSVARAGDAISLTGTALTAIQGNAWTAEFEDSNENAFVVAGYPIYANANVNLQRASNGTSATFNSTTITNAFSTSTQRQGVSAKTGASYLSATGVAATSSGAPTLGSVISAYLGSTGSASFFNGHFMKLGIYNTALMPSQLQSKMTLRAEF